jgi:hypothetical protein
MSFRLGWRRECGTLILFLGWWWLVYGSWAARQASIHQDELRYQRGMRQLRQIERMGRSYRPRR